MGQVFNSKHRATVYETRQDPEPAVGGPQMDTLEMELFCRNGSNILGGNPAGDWFSNERKGFAVDKDC